MNTIKSQMYHPTILFLVVAVLFSNVTQAEESASGAAFAQFSTLVGEWIGVRAGHPVTVTYALIGDGSTLVEEFRPEQGPAMMTMFSIDGDHLLATHYCTAGNQPQMATAPLRDPSARSFAFSLVRITGMKTAADWHNTALEISLGDKDHLTQRWTYLSNGKAGTMILHLRRKATDGLHAPRSRAAGEPG